jgi:hypothetical protein
VRLEASVTGALGVDPGYAKSGEGNAVAHARDGVLRAAWFERYAGGSVGAVHVAGGIELVVAERPAFQGKRSLDAHPETLMRLAWEGALLAGAYASAYGARLVSIPSDDWKGEEPKAANHARLWDLLTPAEQRVLGGAATESLIRAAVRACAKLRWPAGMTGYPDTKAALVHNKLCAAAMLMTVIGRMRKVQ